MQTMDEKLALIIGNLVLQCAHLEHDNARLKELLAAYENGEEPVGPTGQPISPTGEPL